MARFDATTWLLAAGWEDIIPLVVGLGFLALKFISSAMQQQQKAGKPPGGPPPAPPRNAVGKTPAEEVEEFLRRAAQRGKPQKPPEPPKAAPRQPRPQSPPRRVQIPPQGRPVEAEVVERKPKRAPREPSAPTGRGVAEHVQRHLDETEFERQVENISHLATAQAGSVATHVRDAFQHQVGSLTAETPAGPTASATPAPAAATDVPLASQIAAMLRNPDSVRTALVLHEVLRRPDDAW